MPHLPIPIIKTNPPIASYIFISSVSSLPFLISSPHSFFFHSSLPLSLSPLRFLSPPPLPTSHPPPLTLLGPSQFDCDTNPMKEEWWLAAAVSDDTLVAELLVRLKDSTVTAAVLNPLPPPTWGARQPRSSVEKKRDAARRRSSPTTPLSWSDDSSTDPPPSSDRFRSKVSPSNESATAFSKGHPRKKTFAELRDDEISLLKERTHLKKELAALHLTLVEQRSLNDNLKRRKLELPTDSGANSEANSMEPKVRNANQNGSPEAASSYLSKQVRYERTSEEPHSCSCQQRIRTSQEPSFVLPDLNMMPDEDCDPEKA